MSDAPSGLPIVAVVDATVVIHLLNADKLELLGALEGWRFVVPESQGETSSRQAGAA